MRDLAKRSSSSLTPEFEEFAPSRWKARSPLTIIEESVLYVWDNEAPSVSYPITFYCARVDDDLRGKQTFEGVYNDSTDQDYEFEAVRVKLIHLNQFTNRPLYETHKVFLFAPDGQLLPTCISALNPPTVVFMDMKAALARTYWFLKEMGLPEDIVHLISYMQYEYNKKIASKCF